MENPVLGGVFDRVAQVYDASGVEFFKPLARELVGLLDVREGERALDVGCGRGAVLYPLADAVGPTGSVVGIDIAPAMVEATSAEAAERGLGQVRVLHMDGGRPEFAEGSFEVITGSMSIVMIPDLPTVFAHYRALLTDGGRLGMTVPTQPLDIASWRLGPMELNRLVDAIDPASIAADPAIAAMFAGGTFSSVPDISEWLRAAGFTDVQTHHEDFQVVAGSAEQLVAWTQSHGMRAVWECVPQPRRTRVAAEIAVEITERNGGPGPVTAGFPVCYLTAGTARAA